MLIKLKGWKKLTNNKTLSDLNNKLIKIKKGINKSTNEFSFLRSNNNKEIFSIKNSTLEDDEYLEYSINAVIECQTNFLDENKLHLRSIDIVVTERCSLKCKDCSN